MPTTPPPPPTPPRYHASIDRSPSSQYPGLVFARLTCMPPALWEQVEAFLKSQGFRAF